MRRAAILVVAAALAAGAGAPQSRGGSAQEAAAGIVVARARLAAAEATWARAETAEVERVAVLAAAVRDVETALAALRDGIAGAGAEAAALEAALVADRAERRRLLAALVAAARHGEPAAGLHPAGPVAAARAALMLGPAREALAAEGAALGARLGEIEAVRRLEAEGEAELAEALAAVEAARGALRGALVAAREPGPAAPDSAMAALARESATLTDLAARLAGAAPAPAGARLSARNAPEAAGAPPVAPPVVGRVLRGFAEADAGGERRPGLTFAAMPRALVTAPAAGEVAYVGPFLDFGSVVVIAIAERTLVVLAGLAEVAVAPGDAVAAGAPIGFLGGRVLAPQDYLKLTRHAGDAFGAETLYMELWRRTEPVDPAEWLGVDRG